MSGELVCTAESPTFPLILPYGPPNREEIDNELESHNYDKLPKLSLEDAVGQGVYEKMKEEAKTRGEPMRIEVTQLEWIMGCVEMNTHEGAPVDSKERHDLDGCKQWIAAMMPEWQFLGVSEKSELQRSKRVNPLIKGILDRSYGFCYIGPDDKDEESGLVIIKNSKGKIELWNFCLDNSEIRPSKKVFDVEVGKLPHCTDVTELEPTERIRSKE